MVPNPDRLRSVPVPPGWLSGLVAAGTIGAFAAAYSFDPIILSVTLTEAVYLVLALVVLSLVRRLDIGLLELGVQLFVLARLVEFLDELFVGAKPFVEPYLSGLLTLTSLAVISVGVYVLVRERDDRVERLETRAAELSRKNELIEQAPISVTVADIAKEDEPLIEVNDAFHNMTGYTVEQTLGQNCRFLQGEETEQAKVDSMREAVEATESVQVTLKNYRQDGTMFWNEVTLAPLHDAHGETNFYVGFQQDATARKEYELALEEQRDNLDVLTRMLQHDIRNDLQLIQGHGELAREYVEEGGRSHLETTLEATADAIALTKTARDLSETMLETDYEPQPVPLASTLRGEVDALRESYPDAVVSMDDPVPELHIAADELLDSVFRNLLRNAVQHNNKETPKVTVSAAREGEHVTVRIADNGPGVPDERKESVFGKGEKGLESDGTGIGTYLVKTLVSRYSGTVWVEDNEPGGAVFVVTLPIAA